MSTTEPALQDKKQQLRARIAELERRLGGITDVAKAAEALRESEKLFRNVADTAPVMIWVSGLDKLCTFFNKLWLDFTGRTMEQELGDGWTGGVHPEDLEPCLATYTSSFDARSSFQAEYRLRRADGEYRWILDNGIPFYKGDQFAGYIGSCIDITEQKLIDERQRTREARLMHALRLAKVGSWERHVESGTISWSDEMLRILGLPNDPPARLLSFLNSVHPEDRAKITETDDNVRSSLFPVDVEYRIVRPDGEVRFVHSIVEAIRNEQGTPVRIAGATQDVTEQLKARELLRESEERLKRAQRLAQVGNWYWDIKANRIFWSEEICRMFGKPENYTPDYEEFLQAILPSDRERVDRAVQDCLAGKRDGSSFEFQVARYDGDVRTVACISEVLRDDEGLPVRMFGACQDITERKQAEQALRMSQQRLELAQGAAGIGVWDRDTLTNEARCSREYGPLYGLPPGDFAPPLEEWVQLIHPEDRARMHEEIYRALDGTQPYNSEFRVVWPDGTIHWLFGKGQVFRDERGNATRMLGVNMDITERKHAEAALRESEERFRNVADTAPVMIWVTGPDKRATFFNKQWLDFTGRAMEEELGDGWMEVLHPEDAESCITQFSLCFEQRRNYQMEHRLRRADGEYRWLLCRGVPRFEPGGVFVGYIGSSIDITESRRAQEEAFARQKLESLGVLTRGIAHDFNNLLGSILANAELAETEPAADSSHGEAIQTIKTVALRASEIVRELMIFSGQEEEYLEPVDVSWLVNEMLQLLKVSISKHVVLQTDLGEDLPPVRGNRTQIRQIVMNLIINASEAIAEARGVIKVTTSRVNGSRDLKDAMNLPEGDYVQLEVSDSGCGMTEEARTKIFDPFFTTKFAGRGLGLAVVQGIVRAHGGAINVVSAPGQGSTFQILLPCADEEATPNREASAAPVEQIRTQAGTVVVVEDEDALRFAVSKILRRIGFSVIEAGDGTVGLDLIRAHKDEIGVVLLDITLPGTSSQEVFEEARRLRPGLRIILTSAYSWEAVAASFPGLPFESFVRKPYNLANLVNVLRHDPAAHRTATS